MVTNRNKLKNYAPQARRDFIAAVTDRAAYYGLTKEKIEAITEQGDVALISGKPFPRSMAAKRKRLEERITRQGFEPVMEAVAYTWFNRLVAIRYMELHGYLEHGYRVLSHPESKSIPEILEHAEHVDLPGLKKETVIDLKLAGNKEVGLYRLLLTAQCNALHTAMPFLFEKIDDETELLLPDNLLHSDSLIRKLVREIDEEDWQEVEIIGWLYQFYISEKKDQVIGKVVASEDIPAATQLFTPNWIVKYLVQNSLGRQWLATYPQSTLRQQMEYYIEPAEQTPEVQEQLKAITPTNLNPEELTLLDPACGSGHILVEAYDLFKAIYQERGYRAKDIPALILQKNLFGLEIDDRAAQLAAFALMMIARADDRRIFDSEAKPNILAFQDSRSMDAADITHALNAPINKEDVPSEYLFEEIEEEQAGLFSKKALAEKGHVSQGDIASLLALFENAKAFGSLIQIPLKLAAKLPEIEKRLDEVLKDGDLTHASAHVINPLLQQARLLTMQYDAVVANPPYMGSKYFSPTLKTFVNQEYKEAKADLYSCFIQRTAAAANPNGFVGMITIPNWMFLSSFEEMRKSLFDHQTIDTFIHNGRGVFGSDFGSCAFVFRNANLLAYRGSYRRLFDKQGSVASNEELEERFHIAKTFTPSNSDFARIPGNPVAYWVGHAVFRSYEKGSPLGSFGDPRSGMSSCDSARFLRAWHEVDHETIERKATTHDDAKDSGKKWFPYNKGGGSRKWFGYCDTVINWKNDGSEIKHYVVNNPRDPDTTHWSRRLFNLDAFFNAGITWSAISSSYFAVRDVPIGIIPGTGSKTLVALSELQRHHLLAVLNSKMASYFLTFLSPTVNFEAGDVAKLPILKGCQADAGTLSLELVSISKDDWYSSETSWDFQTLPPLQHRASTLQQSQEAADAECLARLTRMKELEEENNLLFIEAYGLQDELSPEVPDDQVTLYRPDREEDIKRLLSYAIGCMMGRYSLDKDGLIYAHSGNDRFWDLYHEKHERHEKNKIGIFSYDSCLSWSTFPPDPDGIVPLMESDWFADDVANRLVEFISVAWPEKPSPQPSLQKGEGVLLEENLKFIADSLGPNNNEQPRDTIRRYRATGFYKHHLSMYKRRPIYWLFSSGKQRAFQCLVYLHRYHEGTLSRMRTEYVIPLQGKITSRIGQLADDIVAASSTSHRKMLERERDTLVKHQAELYTFDEKLRHYADRRISLDLDDGVKVNYGKFGDLLAEVKAVTGGTEEL